MNERKRRSSLVGPVILIGLGIIFLLNNLGVLAWNVWEVILRLWPVLLIAAGLDILIGRRSVWGSLLALVLILAILGGALWVVGIDIETEQVVSGEEIRQALGGATRAEVVIARGSGTLHIEALPESASLVEGVIHRGRGERVRRDFAVRAGTAAFTLRSEGPSWGLFIGEWGDGRGWDLGLNPDVPLQLDISLGAGQSDVDLTGLTVHDLEMNLGVGQARVILPDEGRFRAKIASAIGETVIVIPTGLEARIRVGTALVSTHLPTGYRRQDDAYISPGYERADNRVDLEVSQAIGEVTIRHLETR